MESKIIDKKSAEELVEMDNEVNRKKEVYEDFNFDPDDL